MSMSMKLTQMRLVGAKNGTVKLQEEIKIKRTIYFLYSNKWFGFCSDMF